VIHPDEFHLKKIFIQLNQGNQVETTNKSNGLFVDAKVPIEAAWSSAFEDWESGPERQPQPDFAVQNGIDVSVRV
jgi:hypothetical protein